MAQKKVVALLELSGSYTGGSKFVPSFNYYWTLYPEFITFEIVDIQNDISLCLLKLDEYYGKGYRIFFGPISSTNVSQVIDWYIAHPDAICIAPLAGAKFTLPKNIFRLYPSEFYYLDYIKEQNPSTTRVFYLYNPNQLIQIDLLTELNNKFNDVIEYQIITGSELNVTDIQNYFDTNNITTNDIIFIYLQNGNQRETYFNLFKDVNIGNVKQYDARPVGFPKVSNDVTKLYNNYYCILIISLNTTGIFEKAISTLDTSYAGNSLTSLYLLDLFANNKSLDNAYSFGEFVPWFDDNNGLKYWSYGLYKYDNTGFNKTNIYLNDPNYGPITFNKK